MSTYYYRGRNTSGAMVDGTLQAASKSDALAQLNRQNITPTQLSSSGKKNSTQSIDALRSVDILARFKRRKVKIDELIMFSRQMYALTRSGIPLIRAINGLADTTRSPALAQVLQDISRSLTQGTNLSSAFRLHSDIFGELFIAMIQMGETTGRLDQAFKQLIDHLELEKDTRKKVAAASRYPLIVSAFIVMALFVVNLVIVPQFSGLFSKLNTELPLATQILFASSNFVQKFWFLIILAMIGAWYAFRRWRNTAAGRLTVDRILLKLPILGPIFERIALGRFARPFSMMLDAGVPMLQALSVSSKTTGNHFIKQGIEGMQAGIERGESLLATASASKMFTPLILQMIAVGEESGNVSNLLIDIADFYDQEIEYDLKRITELFEPFLLAIMGAMVVVLALGIFLPLWELGTAYSQ
ncbi:type II secretion system F family protein [Reinekea thalattae]|uniref:Type II secretion system F family protein n=1 Tax=Reinekea thalattae TaxID=2593301 RepID=A0A5C8ZAU3_9GAMM|nr:type II secretion system F family protein [Reinekea thalattae]TXR54308.1 type II secretion system F family protein [Reinekea thalattae]